MKNEVKDVSAKKRNVVTLQSVDKLFFFLYFKFPWRMSNLISLRTEERIIKSKYLLQYKYIVMKNYPTLQYITIKKVRRML